MQGLCEDERLLRMDHLTTLMAQMLASPLFGDRYVTDLLEMTASLSEDVRAVLEEKLSLYRIPGAALPDPLCAPTRPPRSPARQREAWQRIVVDIRPGFVVASACIVSR